jgi:hypothetical protein
MIHFECKQYTKVVVDRQKANARGCTKWYVLGKFVSIGKAHKDTCCAVTHPVW